MIRREHSLLSRLCLISFRGLDRGPPRFSFLRSHSTSQTGIRRERLAAYLSDFTPSTPFKSFLSNLKGIPLLDSDADLLGPKASAIESSLLRDAHQLDPEEVTVGLSLVNAMGVVQARPSVVNTLLRGIATKPLGERDVIQVMAAVNKLAISNEQLFGIYKNVGPYLLNDERFPLLRLVSSFCSLHEPYSLASNRDALRTFLETLGSRPEIFRDENVRGYTEKLLDLIPSTVPQEQLPEIFSLFSRLDWEPVLPLHRKSRDLLIFLAQRTLRAMGKGGASPSQVVEFLCSLYRPRQSADYCALGWFALPPPLRSELLWFLEAKWADLSPSEATVAADMLMQLNFKWKNFSPPLQRLMVDSLGRVLSDPTSSLLQVRDMVAALDRMFARQLWIAQHHGAMGHLLVLMGERGREEQLLPTKALLLGQLGRMQLLFGAPLPLRRRVAEIVEDALPALPAGDCLALVFGLRDVLSLGDMTGRLVERIEEVPGKLLLPSSRALLQATLVGQLYSGLASMQLPWDALTPHTQEALALLVLRLDDLSGTGLAAIMRGLAVMAHDSDQLHRRERCQDSSGAFSLTSNPLLRTCKALVDAFYRHHFSDLLLAPGDDRSRLEAISREQMAVFFELLASLPQAVHYALLDGRSPPIFNVQSLSEPRALHQKLLATVRQVADFDFRALSLYRGLPSGAMPVQLAMQIGAKFAAFVEIVEARDFHTRPPLGKDRDSGEEAATTISRLFGLKERLYLYHFPGVPMVYVLREDLRLDARQTATILVEHYLRPLRDGVRRQKLRRLKSMARRTEQQKAQARAKAQAKARAKALTKQRRLAKQMRLRRRLRAKNCLPQTRERSTEAAASDSRAVSLPRPAGAEQLPLSARRKQQTQTSQTAKKIKENKDKKAAGNNAPAPGSAQQMLAAIDSKATKKARNKRKRKRWLAKLKAKARALKALEKEQKDKAQAAEKAETKKGDQDKGKGVGQGKALEEKAIPPDLSKPLPLEKQQLSKFLWPKQQSVDAQSLENNPQHQLALQRRAQQQQREQERRRQREIEKNLWKKPAANQP